MEVSALVMRILGMAITVSVAFNGLGHRSEEHWIE